MAGPIFLFIIIILKDFDFQKPTLLKIPIRFGKCPQLVLCTKDVDF